MMIPIFLLCTMALLAIFALVQRDVNRTVLELFEQQNDINKQFNDMISKITQR